MIRWLRPRNWIEALGLLLIVVALIGLAVQAATL